MPGWPPIQPMMDEFGKLRLCGGAKGIEPEEGFCQGRSLQVAGSPRQSPRPGFKALPLTVFTADHSEPKKAV
jgi:hypothetical protein